MVRDSIEVLKENLSSINSSLCRLIYSFEVCQKIGIKESYTDEEFVVSITHFL